MEQRAHTGPTTFVIFGAGGDLTSRKLVPALYNLFLEDWLPGAFEIVGLDRTALSSEEFAEHLRQGVDAFSRSGKTEAQSWRNFASHIAYHPCDFSEPQTYSDLSKELASLDKALNTRANRIFYLAVPPSMIDPITQGLAKARLNLDRSRARIVVEKPFGRDLASAKTLNKKLAAIFSESQIFRIDHYLGKETVQNILAFRFGNTLFEPVWNRHYIDHVQITVAEQVGVEHRGGVL